MFAFTSGDGRASVAVFTLALNFSPTAHGFGLFTLLLLGRLFKVAAQFHFTENSLALHFLFQNAQGLFDVIVANTDEYQTKSPLSF